jgi:hypothetical protein
MSLDTDELYDVSNRVFLESILEGVTADDIDYTGYLDRSLLGRCP